jgi:hypothetical protein
MDRRKEPEAKILGRGPQPHLDQGLCIVGADGTKTQFALIAHDDFRFRHGGAVSRSRVAFAGAASGLQRGPRVFGGRRPSTLGPLVRLE